MTGRSPPVRVASAADLHRAWLELVDPDGPFLSVPALRRVWPQGMPRLSPDAQGAARGRQTRLREGLGTVGQHQRDDPAALDAYRAARDTWVRRRTARRPALGRPLHHRTHRYRRRRAVSVRSPNHVVTVSPTGALARRRSIGALVLWSTRSTRCGTRWTTAGRPARSTGWRSCSAPGACRSGWSPTAGGGPSSAPDQTNGGLRGRSTRRPGSRSQPTSGAFVELLVCADSLGGKPEDRLTEIFKDSVAAAEEITEALGIQVRRAVELLVQAFSESALEATRAGRARPAARPTARRLRGRGHRHDARGLPAVRRGTRPAARRAGCSRSATASVTNSTAWTSALATKERKHSTPPI